LHCLNQYSDIGYQPLWQNGIFSPAQRRMYQANAASASGSYIEG